MRAMPQSSEPNRPVQLRQPLQNLFSCFHGWISSAQPVIVMAAVTGRGDTGPIIGFLRSGHTREGRRTQRTVSLHQTESIRAGLFMPSSPTWKWGRKDSTSCTSSLSHTPTQAAPCKILCAVRRIMALLTRVPT